MKHPLYDSKRASMPVSDMFVQGHHLIGIEHEKRPRSKPEFNNKDNSKARLAISSIVCGMVEKVKHVVYLAQVCEKERDVKCCIRSARTVCKIRSIS